MDRKKLLLHYIMVDSLSSGVGTSQVLRYLESLSSLGVKVRLTNFEPESPPLPLSRHVESAGIDWTWFPFGSHGLLGGIGRALRLARHVRRVESDVIHARSDIAALAMLFSSPRLSAVWDMRAFFADERLATGELPRRGVVYWTLRAFTALFAHRADAIVVLAEAAKQQLLVRLGEELADRISVIPTCVDLSRFHTKPLTSDGTMRLVFSGTMNPYYDQTLMARFIHSLRQLTDVEFCVMGFEGDLEPALSCQTSRQYRVQPEAVPSELGAYDVGLSLCQLSATESLAGHMPTKIGELLASGRPVVVSAGVGDMDRIVQQWKCGVIVESDDMATIESAATRLVELVEDPATPRRCRLAAEAHFDLRSGVERLYELYERTSHLSSS